ncbi:hypothetical protein P6F34_gp80 [Pseudomonas phage MiCath]|uniref:Cyanophage baseplate Pam3 plug gp18 domain-containing protein n=1 Tax=Pseudomonas phage MiCath TaxID=3003729 RepID=A0AAE9VJ87_9CAUD|nr:hypothetical protein P6F34_gp80 [Pseudomonas phage MiCath]WAX22446.1 hypothetical protein [Pseudomonas phage MiCath]
MGVVTVGMYDADDFNVQVILNARLYTLHFMWNTECEYWSIEVLDSTGVSLSVDKLSANNYCFVGLELEAMPKGYLLPVSESDNLDRLSFVDLRAEMVYVEDELELATEGVT